MSSIFMMGQIVRPVELPALRHRNNSAVNAPQWVSLV